MTMLIAMPGPWLPEASPGREGAADTLPGMPLLTRLLRKARRLPDALDWRDGVQRALGAAAPIAQAAVAARAEAAVRAGDPVCLAAPLHLVAGLSRVHLPPGGRPQFEPGEEEAWCAAFNAEFGGGGVSLHVVAPGGGWLLRAPFAAGARDVAPELLVGAPLQRRVAADAHERAQRQLVAESEMWLAAHALNRERAARGQLAVNALWFWGGAVAGPLGVLRAPQAICQRGVADAWLQGLAVHLGLVPQAAASWTEAISAVAPGATTLLVPAPDSEGPWRQYWEMVEEQWMAPVMKAWDEGSVKKLRLQLGRTAWELAPGAWLRWPRLRSRSWWQVAGEQRS